MRQGLRHIINRYHIMVWYHTIVHIYIPYLNNITLPYVDSTSIMMYYDVRYGMYLTLVTFWYGSMYHRYHTSRAKVTLERSSTQY
jgi:hypothetical protein